MTDIVKDFEDWEFESTDFRALDIFSVLGAFLFKNFKPSVRS